MFKTIRCKVIFCFGLVLVSFFILLGVTSYQVLCDHLVGMQTQNQNRLAESLCSSIQFFRQNCENEAGGLLGDPEMMEILAQMKHEPDKAGEAGKRLERFKEDQSFVKDIYLINGSYTVAGTSDPRKVRTYLIDRISTAERYEGGVVWDSGYDTKSMMLFGKIEARESGSDPAYLFIQIDNGQILELFNQFRLQNSQRFSLKGVTNGFEVTEQGFFYNYYDNYNDLIHTEIVMGDWQLRTWSDKMMIMGPTRELMWKLVLVLAAAIIIAILTSIYVADRITKPIKKMKETIEHYGEGDFSAKADVVGRDEIASLAEILNQMSEQISDLFDRVKEEENQSRKLELQTLVYQINPHFLYNTLDSVNVLARQNKDYKVAEIVTDLSRLFRLGLHQGRDVVRVRDEIMHVTYYLKIQKLRFDDHLTWEIRTEPELMDYEITKFILQPIVENAIYHGVKSKDEPGHITVSVTEEGDFLLFTVEDTGYGMSEEVLGALRERINTGYPDNCGDRGFGMRNVNQRIRLCYGDECGIEVESEIGKGTRVTIRIRKEIPQRLGNGEKGG